MADSLSSIKSKYPSLSEAIDNIATHAVQKQVHELTAEVVRNSDAILQQLNSEDLMEFLTKFIGGYANRMNPVDFVKVSAKFGMSPKTDGISVVSFLEKYQQEIRASKDAWLLQMVFKAEVLLKKQNNLQGARTEIEEVQSLLNDPVWTHTVSSGVQGAFHAVAADLFLALGNNDLLFYFHLVKFLTYTKVEDLSPEVLDKATKQAGVIALIHPEINDFGELLTLAAFRNSGWISDFLRAIHQGDFDKFEAAVKTHQAELNASADLVSKIDSSLRRKLTMIALAELAAFKTPEKNRRLTFEQISVHCRVPLAEVETLIMTTMGTGLITGVIDEVDSNVVVTSVKPRMLNEERIALLQTRIQGWADRAEQLLGRMNEATPQLLAV